jgi:DNA-binding transcriptional LysR family regulator
MALEPALLSAFVAVADHRSFTGAAAALNRTQSAVSMQVKRLETRLGVVLFSRTTTRVDITPEGEDLLDYARRLLSLGEEAAGQLLHGRIVGRVRLGVMEDLGSTLLPPLLASFARAFPRVQVFMETGLTRGMPERLGTDFDLVVAMHPRGERAGTLLRIEEPVWVCGSGEALKQHEDVVPLAVAPPGCLFRSWAIEALEKAGRRWRLVFVSPSYSAVLSVVAEGLAVTIVKEGLRPRELRSLSATPGWPKLPAAQIRLHAAQALGIPARRLSEHLTAGLRQTHSKMPQAASLNKAT